MLNNAFAFKAPFRSPLLMFIAFSQIPS